MKKFLKIRKPPKTAGSLVKKKNDERKRVTMLNQVKTRLDVPVMQRIDTRKTEIPVVDKLAQPVTLIDNNELAYMFPNV